MKSDGFVSFLENIDVFDRKDNSLNFVMFEFYSHLNKGSSFGELAITTNKGRAARIRCSQDCTFGVITKKDYQQVMNTNYLREVAHKIHVLANFHIFKKLSH